MSERPGDAESEARAVRTLQDFVERLGVTSRRKHDTSGLDAAAVEVLKCFSGRDVEALLLKGPALAQLLYRPGEERIYVDVDLLVAPRDRTKARHALAELGYRNISETLGIDDIGGVVHEESWFGSGPGADRDLLIELHLSLAGARAQPEAVWDALVPRRRTWIELHGHEVPVLDPEGLAMHLATHAAQHGPRYAKGLHELALGLERWPFEVWERAAALAREIDAVAAFAGGLRLSPVGSELSRTLGLAPDDRLDWEIRHADTRPRGTFHLEALVGTPGLLPRVAIIRRALLPSRQWIAWQYAWARSGRWRLWLAYAAHWARAPRWAIRAWRFRRRAERAR